MVYRLAARPRAAADRRLNALSTGKPLARNSSFSALHAACELSTDSTVFFPVVKGHCDCFIHARFQFVQFRPFCCRTYGCRTYDF